MLSKLIIAVLAGFAAGIYCHDNTVTWGSLFISGGAGGGGINGSNTPTNGGGITAPANAIFQYQLF